MVINEAVSGLLLDERNPRFREQVNGQDEAVTVLLLDAADKLVNLAHDIATQNSLNPTDLPVVVEEDGELVVIEGNRRLAALKLLRNPALATAAAAELDEPLVGKFKTLQQIGVGPDSIDAFQADSREAARHWIKLRHTGENDGVGVVGWKSWQTNNYRRRRGSQADRATMFCEAVEVDFPDDTELLSNVVAVRQNRLTTLGRLVADPDVRRDFGFQFDEDAVLFDYETDDLRAGVSRIFSDLALTANGVSVTDIKSKDQRRQYVADRSEVLPNRANRLSTPRRPGEKSSLDLLDENDGGTSTDVRGGVSSVGSGVGNGAGSAGNRTSTSGELNNRGGISVKGRNGKTPPPENVIFKSLKMPHLNPRIRELLDMSHKINIVDAAPVSGILVRVLLELTVTEAIACGAVTGATEGDSLKKKVRQALLTLDRNCENPSKRDKSLEMAWTRTQDGDALAVQSLNAFVHNIHGNAAPSEVRALSQTFRPVLERLDQLIGSHVK
ncbi:hypothetical protein [Propionibacterium ruminifibrarum]|uniref:hypothetical protein n=1 Tax=Propionibacterium ruminifibrarum TaxID=1962131 RepID=UPI0011C476C8|nr:hypothetical protein [Propionibacterium ruminifibrarum]